MNTMQSIECNPNANWEAYAGVWPLGGSFVLRLFFMNREENLSQYNDFDLKDEKQIQECIGRVDALVNNGLKMDYTWWIGAPVQTQVVSGEQLISLAKAELDKLPK